MTAQSSGFDGFRRGNVRTDGSALQICFQVLFAIPVEQMPKQSPVEVGRAKHPVGNRERKIHVHFHHQTGVVVCRMMSPYGVDQRHIAHKPVLVNMAAKMHEFIGDVDSGRRTHKQPRNIGREHVIEHQRSGDRDQYEYHQGVGREKCNAPVIGISEAHLAVREKLMVLQRVSFIDRPESRPSLRPVHDFQMQVPLEYVARDKKNRNCRPFPPLNIFEMLGVDPYCGQPDYIDDGDVEWTVVPTGHSRSVFVSVSDLLLRNHHTCPPTKKRFEAESSISVFNGTSAQLPIDQLDIQFV